LDKKAIAIHHGLDLKRYSPAAKSHHPPVLLSVGRLVEKKGLIYLLKACRRLKDQKQEFVCHIVGPGPDYQKLESLIAELSLQDTVKLWGGLPHDEVLEHYNQATLFVLPCIRGDDGSLDGIPNVLAEAMAVELPVVTTTVSGIPELVEDRVNGLLVPPRDEEALTSALARLLDDPVLCNQLGKEGRQTILKKFDINQNVRLVYDVFVRQSERDYVN
jgi:glycosyltransferase involved in cell wall biosynthesis